jgi:hypothetical protein
VRFKVVPSRRDVHSFLFKGHVIQAVQAALELQTAVSGQIRLNEEQSTCTCLCAVGFIGQASLAAGSRRRVSPAVPLN